MDKLLIVGLGNPGNKYADTRHNIGFMVLDSLNLDFKDGFQGLFANENIKGKKVFFLKPFTYMNLSGQSVGELARYFDIKTENILIVHDDLDMDFGKLKFRKNGSAGGHNGIKSIISHLNSENFVRLKLGIGKSKGNTSSYVLNPFNSDEKKYLEEFINTAKEALDTYINEGLKKAMNQFNNINILQEDSECHNN
jgi:PTH1 family peptidyl-tRNA hydrolase